ncbi:MFS transporter [Amycolatopsis sp. NPDC049688]|uniref:MFS transporter n=1 Tax=Amycolatopsis sp. NPDC049688 TaxID=3154733 RepID=UPI00343948B9
MTPAPLSRNRNYRLLWGSQLLSVAGFSGSMIAFPLLVLDITHSAAASGLVLTASAVAGLVAGIPAGALADRWNRRKLMLGCEAGYALAMLSVVAACWWNFLGVPHIVAVAVVIGLCGALFDPAEEATLPRVVPAEQLASAVAMNGARGHLGQLSGTALGGILYTASRWLPFAADALAHTVSLVGLLFLRVPAQAKAGTPLRGLHHEILDGLRWVWGQRLLRAIGLCAVGLNFFFAAFYLVVIVLAQQRGVPSGEIGVMAAMFGGGGILGALAAPRLHRALSPYLAITGVFWMLAVLTPLAVFIDRGYVMGVLLAAMAFLAPTANTTIGTFQLLLTPGELRGRLTGVMGVATGVAAAAGPALGGGLMEVLTGSQAVLVCAAGMAVVTILTTFSATVRSFSREVAAEALSSERSS